MSANVGGIPEAARLGAFKGEFDYYIKSWEMEKQKDPYVPNPTSD